MVVVQLVLYATVGVASQISTAFLSQMRTAHSQIGSAKGVEKAAYGVAVGVYATVSLPFVLIQVPFWFIGKLEHQVAVIVAAIVVLVVVAGIFFGGGLAQIQEWLDHVDAMPVGED